MIKTRATNFGDDYFYCKDCKQELSELMPALMQEIERQIISSGVRPVVKDEVWQLWENERKSGQLDEEDFRHLLGRLDRVKPKKDET